MNIWGDGAEGGAIIERREYLSALVILLIGQRIQVDGPVGDLIKGKQLSHRPAEFTPFQCKHHHRVFLVVDRLCSKLLRLLSHRLRGCGGFLPGGFDRRGRIEPAGRCGRGYLDLIQGHLRPCIR